MPKICYECKRADCPDMLAGNTPSEEEVFQAIDNAISGNSKHISLEEFLKDIETWNPANECLVCGFVKNDQKAMCPNATDPAYAGPAHFSQNEYDSHNVKRPT